MPANPAQTGIQLSTSVEQMPGVGRDRAQQLHRLGIATAGGLLFHFPRDYQDLSDERKIEDLEEDRLQTVRGVVSDVGARSGGFGKTRVSVLIDDGSSQLRANWFNQPFIRGRFDRGQHVAFTGKPKMRGLLWQMSHPQVTFIDADEASFDSPLLPVYALTEGVSQYHMRRIVQCAIDEVADQLEEVFPQALLDQYKLMPIVEAVRAIHRPADNDQLDRARRRFLFQELLVLQLALALRQSQQRQLQAPALPATAQIDARIRRLLPFTPTECQNKAIEEVAADMALDRPMNRLLQGEVGSGKTIVALYAMLTCVAHGKQAVLMAPTEILARQHAATLENLLTVSRVRYDVLTGGLPKRQRDELLRNIGAGEIDLVIGTQAIIQDDVKFPNLGLVVVDEQHKFGVRQRAALRDGETSPHYLVMTATPIPRTTSMTLFGDLDQSTLRELPAGRQPVNTYLVMPELEKRWWAFVRDRLREGRQAFVVAPLVDESETTDEPSVSAAFEALTQGELEMFRLGLLHGRMSSAEKSAAMDDFRSGKTQVLVSTTVIEVGVDVPNASVMTVAGANRFGLAQLHQLRGRIGRGSHPGYCGVLAGDLPEEKRDRLTKFAASNDGFELAELDFEIRGPGDLFGDQQHGLPPLRIADLRRDQELLQEARREARLLIADDPGLAHGDHDMLRAQVIRRYGESLDLGDVG
ncbi:ATP-dependent DNA helicase RecG [Pirellulales bacterium]|nr:ATP-dependent DNA helicase RecG [Pirellulales bacterium]